MILTFAYQSSVYHSLIIDVLRSLDPISCCFGSGSDGRGPKSASGRSSASSEPVVDEWLVRREKRRAAQGSGRLVSHAGRDGPFKEHLTLNMRAFHLWCLEGFHQEWLIG